MSTLLAGLNPKMTKTLKNSKSPTGKMDIAALLRQSMNSDIKPDYD